jgi:hypothetical protein
MQPARDDVTDRDEPLHHRDLRDLRAIDGSNRLLATDRVLERRTHGVVRARVARRGIDGSFAA